MFKSYYIIHFVLEGKSNIESFRCSFTCHIFRKQKLLNKIEKAVNDAMVDTDRNRNQKHLLKS